MLAHTYQSVPGFFHGAGPAYRYFLDHLNLSRPITWVEVGVLEGQSLLWLGTEILNNNWPITLHAVDHFRGYAGIAPGLRERFDANTKDLREALGDRFVLHPEDSLTAVKDFGIGSVDVVWLDGDHSIIGCKNDVWAWYPTLKYGGFLGDNAGHFPDVQFAFSQLPSVASQQMPREDGSSWILVKK